MVGDGKQVVEVGGHRLALTHLEKVLYPATGFTKGDVLQYYAHVADALVPLAAGRAATRKRWPDGVGTADEPGKVFYVKNLEPHAPEWIHREAIEHDSGRNVYPLVDDLATLTWLAQMATLEVHVPQWRFAADGTAAAPDRLVLDLDPGEGAGLQECAEVARLLRPLLEGMGLVPVPVTSGSKGIHLYAPLDGRQSSDEVTEVAHELARALEADHPDLVVSDMKKTLRSGKVLVDWSQNRAAKTTLVPYSLRGTSRPMAAAPRTWEELDAASLRQLEPHEVLERLGTGEDPLAVLHRDAPKRHPTHRPASRGSKQQDEDVAPSGRDPLHVYRSMRDATRTPEPVPEAAPTPGAGNSFVIQEHHARRLHWDFRLERDGVLVSWALPKGVPGPGERNHLAVHTEDHPLEYGSFEGSIPKGEYGGGEVRIWDSGTYDAEKFRDGEVIATLTGRPDGGLGGKPARIALIRTGDGRRAAGQDPADHAGEQWLAHRMKLPGSSDAQAHPDHAAAEREAPAVPETETETETNEPTATTRLAPVPSPMLATPANGVAPDRHEEWSIETKWDGVRAVARVDHGRVALTSRNELDLTPTYPELAALADQVHADGAVLDGEIVALDPRGHASFSLLQQRMGLTKPRDVAAARRRVETRFVVFDVLEVDGHDVTAQPYRERRRLLELLVTPDGPIDVPLALATATGDALTAAIDAAMAESARLGLEGIVLKRADSPYRPGARSGDWTKRKHERHQEVVVGGWRPGSGRRSGGVGSLLVGINDGGSLRYVGRVGTGFSDADLDEIEHRLASTARKTSPFTDVPSPDARDAHWVTPALVGEVRFAEWTDTGRLRQASWRGWRPDKRPDDVVRES